MKKIRNIVARIAIRALLWAGGWKLDKTPQGMRWVKGKFIGDWRYAVYITCTDEFWEEKK